MAGTAGETATSSFGGALSGAVQGGVEGAIIGALGGLFSDTAHHNSKVAGHLKGYQEIYSCAVAGSLPAARKLLWGKTGDYDEIKGQIASMWAAFAQQNPALAAQAQSLGGQSNDQVSLGGFQGCSANIGYGNPASLASQNVVGIARQDPATAGSLGQIATGTFAELTSGSTASLIILGALAGVAIWAFKNERG